MWLGAAAADRKGFMQEGCVIALEIDARKGRNVCKEGNGAARF